MSMIEVKAYLIVNDEIKFTRKTLENNATEIRRFNIENSSNVYKNLIDQIMRFYKSEIPTRHDIKTYYLDDEEQFVAFSTDTEFQYAIELQMALKKSAAEASSSNAFKVYIVKVNGKTTTEKKPKQNANENHHQKHYKCVLRKMIENFKQSTNSVMDSDALAKFKEHLKSSLGPLGVDVDYIDHLLKKEFGFKNAKNDSIDESQTTTDPNATVSSTVLTDENGNTTTTTITKSSISNTTSKHVTDKPEDNAVATKEIEETDGFNMVDIEKEEKILKAVEQLKAMGFDDENNWLTALVSSKGGKINDVLDSLSPINSKMTKPSSS